MNSRRRGTRRILVSGGIGDALLMTPALRALKEADPRSQVRVLCVHRQHYQVLQGNPYIDVLKLVDGDRVEAWIKAAPLDYLALCLDRLRGPFGTNCRVEVPVYGRYKPSIIGNRHATEMIGELLGVVVTDRRLEICLSTDEVSKGGAAVAGFVNPVGLHVLSSSCNSKHWPLERWESLVDRNKQYTFVQFGGPDDPRVAGAADLRRGLTLRESFGALTACKAFVGVESLMAHAANAVGVAGVVLFGPSSPQVWGHPNSISLTVGLRCAPCLDYMVWATCPYGAPCMSDIAVADVERALEIQMSGQLPAMN